MRLFRTLCATLGTLFIVSTPSLGAYAAAIPPLSETSVLATDVHLTDAASALSMENKGSATVAAPLRAAAEETSSTPSLWLLTALIISIIILVLVVVFIVYALRSQKTKKKSQAQRVPPSGQGSVPFPVRPGMPEASAYTGGPAQFGQRATYNPYPAQDATAGDPTPRETGFVWQRQTGPAPAAPQQPIYAPTAGGTPGQPLGAPMGMPPSDQRGPNPAAPQNAPQQPPMGGAAVVGGTASMSGEKTELLTTFGGSDPDAKTQLFGTYDDQADPDAKTQLFGTYDDQGAAAAAPAAEPVEAPKPESVATSHGAAPAAPIPAPAPETAPAAPEDPGMLTVKLPRFKPEAQSQPAPEAESAAAPEDPGMLTVKLPRYKPEAQTDLAPTQDPQPEQPAPAQSAAQPEQVDAPTPEQAPAEAPQYVDVPTVKLLRVPTQQASAASPEQAAPPEPEHVASPEASSTPVAAPAPQPVAPPQPPVAPEAMPAPASSLGNDSDEGVPTVQMPQFDRMDSFDWDSPAASQQAPQPQQAPQTPAVPVAPQMQVPQQPMPAAPAQPFPPVDQGAAAQQVPTAPQAPEQSGGFQESWTSQFSWSEEIRPEPQAQKKRRWPWSKRRKQKGEEEAAQALPEGNAPGATAHMPVIAVDAQDDDWQNWNSRN